MKHECPGPLLLAEYPLKPIAAGVTTVAPTLRPDDTEPDERFQGAMFAYAWTHLSGYHVHVAFEPSNLREGDEDCILRWDEREDVEFAPVQLKSLVSARTDQDTDLERELKRKVGLYGSPDLHLVWTINREMDLDPKTLDLPRIKAAALWIVSAASTDLTRWVLTGDFVNVRKMWPFPYPHVTARPAVG